MRTAYKGQTAIGGCEPPILIDPITGGVIVALGKVDAIDSASDRIKAYTYEPAAGGGTRLKTITTSSAALGLSYVETISYVPGTNDIQTQVRS